MLYLAMITQIFYRFTFLELTMERLTPPYWINMGAVAIATLAGSTLMLHAGTWQLLVTVRPFLLGFTIYLALLAWVVTFTGILRHLIAGAPSLLSERTR